MRIGIPLDPEQGLLVEEFSTARTFAVYDVHDESRAVSFLGRQTVAQPREAAGAGGEEPACHFIPAVLKEQGVEVLIVHHISAGAVNHLLESGVLAIQDAPCLAADALISHLVSGTLQARPPEAAMHGADETCGGSGGCGHCCGGRSANNGATA